MMHASAIEILATVLIAVTLIKLAVVTINAQAWIALTRALYARPWLTTTVSYLLAGLVLYLLVRSGLTMVQILAVCLFVALLFVPGFAPFAGVAIDRFESKGLRQVLKDQWVYTAIWIVLLGWGLYELFVL